MDCRSNLFIRLSRQKLARNTIVKSEVFDNQGFRFLLRDLPMLGFAPGGRTSRTSAGHHRRLKQGDLCLAEIVFCALPVLSKASF